LSMAEVKIVEPVIAAKKLLDRAMQSKDYFVYGIKNPKRSPTEAAISMADTWHAKVSSPETKRKWIEHRKAAGDESWLAGLLGKGIDRWAPGIQLGIGKYLTFAEEFFPYMASGLATKVYTIQKRTLDDSIRRVAELIRHNAAFKRKKRAFTLDELRSLAEKVSAASLG